ncbi:MAG: hypothetical protein M3135_06800 [Actinomycetota bacterium]|nr:hypothetical protein [Actinomycetota bacterium]
MMAVMDFKDVAARIAAGLTGIRACLVVSRDGLSLGAYPADGEGKAREVWDVLEQLGDLKRGFVEMGMELWVIARRGPYGAVVVSSPDVKPGLVLDRIEANLVAAEQERSRQAVDEPVPPLRPDPFRRPRSPLHPEPRMDQPEPDLSPSDPEQSVSETERSEATDSAADETGRPELVTPTAPLVDLSRVPEPEADPEPEPEPVPEPVPIPVPEPDPEPAPVAEDSAPEPAESEWPPPAAPEPIAQPAAEVFAQAVETEPAAAPVEQIQTFTPATAPTPEVGDVYVAGVAPETAPPPVPVPTPEPPAAEEPPAKKRRRFRKKSGEVDRVALAREFSRLLQDEVGVRDA